MILEKTWAGYLVVIATSTLIPFEIYEIARKPTTLRFALFLLNVGIVIYLIVTLKESINYEQEQSIEDISTDIRA